MEQKCQAHNLKVAISNPTPTINLLNNINDLDKHQRHLFLDFFYLLRSKMISFLI